MKKIINPCTVKTLKSEEVDAFCEISFENNKLRIHGVVGPILGGGCWGECGQCINDIRNGTPVDGWDVKMINRFCDTWKRWHLNDMRPECEHQRADGWRELAEKNITFYEFVLKHEFFEKRDKLKEEIIEMAKNGESISLSDDQKALLNLEDSVTLEKNYINDSKCQHVLLIFQEQEKMIYLRNMKALTDFYINLAPYAVINMIHHI